MRIIPEPRATWRHSLPTAPAADSFASANKREEAKTAPAVQQEKSAARTAASVVQYVAITNGVPRTQADLEVESARQQALRVATGTTQMLVAGTNNAVVTGGMTLQYRQNAGQQFMFQRARSVQQQAAPAPRNQQYQGK